MSRIKSKGIVQISITMGLIREIWEEISGERRGLLRKQFPGISDETFDQAVAADPANGKYSTWILRMASGSPPSLRFPEDAQKTKERLTQFAQLSKKRGFKGERDINKYKSYGDLAQTIKNNEEVKTKGEIKRELAIDGAELIKEHLDGSGHSHRLYKITTVEAGLALDWRDTEWCVKDPDYFNHYGPPFYYLMRKPGGFPIYDHSNWEPYQLLHVHPFQCMDVNDQPTSLSTFGQMGLDLSQCMSDHDGMLDHLINTDDGDMDGGNEAKTITDKFKQELSRTKDWAIAVQVAAKLDGNRWKEIEKPLLAAYKANPGAFDYVDLEVYARQAVHGRWPELESVVLELLGRPESGTEGNDAWKLAAYYTDGTICTATKDNSNWPEAEELAIKNGYASNPDNSRANLRYARAMWERFEPGEAAMLYALYPWRRTADGGWRILTTTSASRSWLADYLQFLKEMGDITWEAGDAVLEYTDLIKAPFRTEAHIKSLDHILKRHGIPLPERPDNLSYPLAVGPLSAATHALGIDV